MRKGKINLNNLVKGLKQIPSCEETNKTPAEIKIVNNPTYCQTTAKTLPKTGDSSSMLLVLGGLLSGLSGLGLAAPSRKRD
ncbi:TPA: LPXTG cell wall anchor domain-containing protein [Streptococcus suis]